MKSTPCSLKAGNRPSPQFTADFPRSVLSSPPPLPDDRQKKVFAGDGRDRQGSLNSRAECGENRRKWRGEGGAKKSEGRRDDQRGRSRHALAEGARKDTFRSVGDAEEADFAHEKINYLPLLTFALFGSRHLLLE